MHLQATEAKSNTHKTQSGSKKASEYLRPAFVLTCGERVVSVVVFSAGMDCHWVSLVPSLAMWVAAVNAAAGQGGRSHEPRHFPVIFLVRMHKLLHKCWAALKKIMSGSRSATGLNTCFDGW